MSTASYNRHQSANECSSRRLRSILACVSILFTACRAHPRSPVLADDYLRYCNAASTISAKIWTLSTDALSGYVGTPSGPAEGALVMLTADSVDSTVTRATLSTTSGLFSLSGIVPGNYWVTVSLVGFDVVRAKVDVRKGERPDTVKVALRC